MPQNEAVTSGTYCRGSILSDAVFFVILWSYLEELPAKEAAQRIEIWLGPEHVPLNTAIMHHYDRIGLALFEHYTEAEWCRSCEGLAQAKQDNPTTYKQQINHLCDYFDSVPGKSDVNQIPDPAPATEWGDLFDASVPDYYLEIPRELNGRFVYKKARLGLACLKGILTDEYKRRAGKNKPINPEVFFPTMTELKINRAMELFEKNPC